MGEQLTQSDVKKIKEEIDLAFSKIDFVGDFTFTGGEPLLNQELEEVLGYIAENYLEQIGSLKIITNGMIEPGKKLLNCMKKYGMYVEISDYTATNPELKQRVMENYEKYSDKKSGGDFADFMRSSGGNAGFDPPSAERAENHGDFAGN